MEFKTNAKCMGCVSVIRKSLAIIAPESSWEFELDSPDKRMTYVGKSTLSEAEALQVIKLVEAAGFKIERI